MTNKYNTVLYTGVTSDLKGRVFQHKEKINEGFSKKYNANKLVYYDVFESPQTAIEREKQIKSWNRKRKLDLINSINKNWDDLYESI